MDVMFWCNDILMGGNYFGNLAPKPLNLILYIWFETKTQF
jgi:hypothetical protein